MAKLVNRRKAQDPILDDGQKHQVAMSAEEKDEEGALGDMPATGEDTLGDEAGPNSDVQSIASEMGLYKKDQDMDHPEEVGLGEQLEELAADQKAS